MNVVFHIANLCLEIDEKCPQKIRITYLLLMTY
jgi:hypothetical protein